jgi:hypothetical protein
MKRSALALLLFAAAFPLQATQLASSCNLVRLNSGTLTSRRYVSSADSSGVYVNWTHIIAEGNAFEAGYNLTPISTLMYGAIGTPPNCYRASISADEDAIFFPGTTSAVSDELCLYGPPAPDQPPTTVSDCDTPPCTPYNSPVVIALDGGAYPMSGTGDPVLFDINATGTPIRTAWTAPAANVAFLWLDRNHNGKVDDGTELFGTATPTHNGLPVTNGFDAMLELDANRNGLLDDADPVWPELKLWRDLNHNGISEADEISTVASSNLAAISTTYYWRGRRDQYGNLFRYASYASFRNEAGNIRSRPIYDVFFLSGE